MVRQVEKGEDGVTRFRWVRLRTKKGFKSFDAYSVSVKNFKGDFLYVVSVTDPAMAEVVTRDAGGRSRALNSI